MAETPDREAPAEETPDRGGGFHPDSHILTELKDELGWATRELAAVNGRLAELESGFEEAVFHNKATSRQQARLARKRDVEELELHIDHLYELHRVAEERFLRMERAFEIARSYNLLAVVAVNLRNVLLPGRPEQRRDMRLRDAIDEIAEALHAYCWVGPTDEADARVRQSLLQFESCLIDMEK
ncbi:MAG: hypothetical protein ABT940_10575 [Alphaproteobacteria bacterium]